MKEGPEYLGVFGSIDYHENNGNKYRFRFCKGTLEIEYHPTTALKRKLELKTSIFDDTFGQNFGDEDFIFLCQDKEFKFNKTKLILVSEIFRKMIENPVTKEAISGSVEIDDFSPETIQAFQNVLFSNENTLDEKDLTIELMMFGNKYFIKSLVKVVGDYLKENLKMDNIFEVIQAAYHVNNESLLETSAKFLTRNSGFKSDEKWIKFKKEHPECFVKLIDYIIN